jgi:hypothetical protein
MPAVVDVKRGPPMAIPPFDVELKPITIEFSPFAVLASPSTIELVPLAFSCLPKAAAFWPSDCTLKPLDNEFCPEAVTLVPIEREVYAGVLCAKRFAFIMTALRSNKIFFMIIFLINLHAKAAENNRTKVSEETADEIKSISFFERLY